MGNEKTLDELVEVIPETCIFLVYAELMPFALLFSALVSVIEICNEIAKTIEKENEGEKNNVL